MTSITTSLSLSSNLRASGSIAPYTVLGISPHFVADFVEEEYVRNAGGSTFSDTITHTRASTATYVDANGILQTAGVNVPRVGHHVWNGSAWVNEGVLHESEARTNLNTYSEADVTNWIATGGAVITLQSDNLFGAFNGVKVASGGAATDALRTAPLGSVTNGTAYSVTVIWKSGTSDDIFFRLDESAVGSSTASISAAGVLSVIATTKGTISLNSHIPLGNDVYQTSVTWTPNFTGGTSFGFGPYSSVSGEYITVYTGQLEAAPTPSSYIPTAGSTVTRAADVMTIPAANLPWPAPEYIGPELVTNGTFDTDISGWSDASSAGGSIAWNPAGYLDLDADTATSRAGQDISVTAGAVYAITVQVVSLGGSTASGMYLDGSGSSSINFVNLGVGTHTIYYVAPDSLLNISLRNFTTGTTVSIDNISVREINPLAVSIQMDGRVTYADTNSNVSLFGGAGEAVFFLWKVDGSNYVEGVLNTFAGTGRGDFNQEASGVRDAVFTSNNYYSPGVLVPFNIASRHGSTFINGAVDGTALTADTTPVALPDLSASDLNLGNTMMGTIKTFRVWANDIGDAGIAGATA